MSDKREFSKWEPLIASSFVKELEDLRLEAYLCPAGIPTIGYGHTGGVHLGERITKEQADQLLTKDLTKIALALKLAIKVRVTEGQYRARMSFAYNVGAKAVRDSTMLKYLNQGSVDAAGREFGRWIYANGRRLEGLVNRRKRETEVFLS